MNKQTLTPQQQATLAEIEKLVIEGEEHLNKLATESAKVDQKWQAKNNEKTPIVSQ